MKKLIALLAAAALLAGLSACVCPSKCTKADKPACCGEACACPSKCAKDCCCAKADKPACDKAKKECKKECKKEGKKASEKAAKKAKKQSAPETP